MNTPEKEFAEWIRTGRVETPEEHANRLVAEGFCRWESDSFGGQVLQSNNLPQHKRMSRLWIID